MADDPPIPGTPASAIERAQQGVVRAALAQNLNPASAAISAYVNLMLQSARLDALIEVLCSTPAPTKEDLDAAIVRALERKAQELESQARRMQFAQAVEEARSGPIVVGRR